jgi:hypothetical protein
MHDVDRPQLEAFEFEEELGPRGQAGRNPAARFAAAIRRLGFLPSDHFVERLLARGMERGIRWDPRTFPGEFANARHYRQTRPGYNTRIAVVRGMPIVYRVGGRQGNRIRLVTALPPNDPLPPVAPARYPLQREAFETEWEAPPDYRTPPPAPDARATLARVAAARRALNAAKEQAVRVARSLDAQRLAIAQGKMKPYSADPSLGPLLTEAARRLRAARGEFDAARQDIVPARKARQKARGW